MNPEIVAVELNSKRYKKLQFLLINKIFFEFISFGLFDLCAKVKEYSKHILLLLMECDLLVSPDFYARIKQLFGLYIPYAQVRNIEISSQTGSIKKD